MGGQVRSDLTQVSGSWSKCKEGFCSHGLMAIEFEFGREMGTHPGRSVPMFGLGTPTPWVRGPKNGVPGYNMPKL